MHQPTHHADFSDSTSLTKKDRRSPLLDHEFVTFTETLRRELGVIRSLVESRASAMEEPSIEAVAETLYPSFEAWLDDRLLELARLWRPLPLEQRDAHGQFFRDRLRPFTDESRFLARTNERPRGYAGDSEMMQMIYADELRGDSVFGCLLHRHPIRSAAARAVRHRVGFIAEILRDHSRSPGQPLRVMSLACGPARELRSLVQSPEDAERVELVLADQDEEALCEAKEEALFVEQSIRAPLKAETIQLSVRDILTRRVDVKGSGQFDVIYSLGLFDYLNRAVAKNLVEQLMVMLRPGGKLVIGNFHVGCSTRTYLDVWMNWPLLYRTTGELMELSDDLDLRSRRIETEPTGSQIFLVLEKLTTASDQAL